MTSSTPNKVYIDTAKHSAKRVSTERKRKATEEAKENRQRSKYMYICTDDSTAACRAYSRHDNGILPEEIFEDISPEHLEQLKVSFYETKVVITEEKAKKIEQQTREQSDSELWITERRKRITASNVGRWERPPREARRYDAY